jgi:hypothetical protein
MPGESSDLPAAPSASSPHAPLPITTADATLAAGQPSSPARTKRPREEDEAAEETSDSDARPAQRVRTESYTSRNEDVSWVDWLMLPVRTFMIGFRQGRSQARAEEQEQEQERLQQEQDLVKQEPVKQE